MKNIIRQVVLAKGKRKAVKTAMSLDPALTLSDAVAMVDSISKEIEEEKPNSYKPEGSRRLDLNNISLGKGLLMILIGSILFVGAMIYSAYKNPRPSISPTPIIENSSWDGSVRQVELYLKANLKDPDSYQSIEWSRVVKTDKGGFFVRHKYRAKNSFGGFVIEEKIFTMDAQGNVTGTIP